MRKYTLSLKVFFLLLHYSKLVYWITTVYGVILILGLLNMQIIFTSFLFTIVYLYNVTAFMVDNKIKIFYKIYNVDHSLISILKILFFVICNCIILKVLYQVGSLSLLCFINSIVIILIGVILTAIFLIKYFVDKA